MSFTKCSLPASIVKKKKVVNINLALVICLKFVFIEMLDKLIT